MPPDEESKKWAEVEKIYMLTDTNGSIELNVSLDVDPELKDFFNKNFPKALDIIK